MKYLFLLVLLLGCGEEGGNPYLSNEEQYYVCIAREIEQAPGQYLLDQHKNTCKTMYPFYEEDEL